MMEENNSEIKVKKKLINIDSEMFWMLFSLALVLILVYMSLDFRNAVEMQVRSLEISNCANICNELMGNNINLTIPSIS